MMPQISNSVAETERAEIDQFLLDSVTGMPLNWPSSWSNPAAHEAIWQRLHFHGICLSISRSGALNQGWPSSVSKYVSEEARLQVMWELFHRPTMAKLLASLAAKNVQCLVMKGTALAYALYEDPAERRRGDTDLLVREHDLNVARRTLGSAGFLRVAGTNGFFGDLHYQEIWRLDPGNGLTHDIDLHWQVTNSRALKSVLGVEEFFSAAVPLDRLSPHAFAPDPVSRLIHGAVNRAVHGRDGYWSLGQLRYDQDRLAWARDFHLQASRFEQHDWQAFVDKAIAKGLAPICLDALRFAQRCFSTAMPSDAISVLERASKSSLALTYIGDLAPMGKAWADLAATDGYRSKILFILARAFPSKALLRAKYPDRPHWPVWALQILRLSQSVPRIIGARPS